jgi:hypothetical protein
MEAPFAPADLLAPPPAVQRFPLFDRLLTCMVSAGQGMQALCLLLSLSRAVLENHLIRLGLPTPHDRPMRSGGAKAWSMMDTLRLIMWRLAGVHPEIIAQRLDTPRSANAIRAKARRLGIPCPSRKELHKPAPESLRDPDAGMILNTLMLAAREPGQSADEALQRLRDRVVVVGSAPIALRGEILTPVAGTRSAKKQGKAPSQREFTFFSVIGGSDKADAGPTVIPATEAEVDFGNLRWFASLRGRNNPQRNKIAVWVAFMLTACGVHYVDAAEKLGVSPDSFRTFKTRTAIPSDSDRRKLGQAFDREAAGQTLARSGYELRRCLELGFWFWEHKSNRGVRLCPQARQGERVIGLRGNRFSVVTRPMLEEEKRLQHAPFAKDEFRLPA